jgi:Xaa-Pro aminopeptidase
VIRRLALAALLMPGLLAAQTRQEYASRRMTLQTKLPPDGILVALGAQEPPQDYQSFYQSPSFYYLTGFKEPDAALLMIKKGGQIVSSTMFVRPRQPSREVWTGTRLGTDGIELATGMRGRPTNDLWPVLDSLAKTGQSFHFIGDLGPRDAEDEDSPTRVTRTPDEQLVDRLRKKHPTVKVTVVNDEIERMRGTKSPAELALIRQAVDITVIAQKEAMAAVKEVRNEFELQALIEYTFRRNGADRPSFSSIVGSGSNSTTLHYNVDDRFIDANDLIVMDIGASYKGYAADVTRTVPASGHFSLAQRDIYTLVRDAQSAAERQLKLGAPSRLMNDSANAVLATGLARFRLIDSPDATYDCSTGPNPRQCPQYRMYYMHGLGHGIGLEVHDPDQYSYTAKIEPGSVFTLEPGIYIREHVLEEMPNTSRNREIAGRLRNAVAIYRNIGVRIEDDYAVTDKGVECLSRGAPREIADVEAQMKTAVPVPAKRDGALVERYRAQ